MRQTFKCLSTMQQPVEVDFKNNTTSMQFVSWYSENSTPLTNIWYLISLCRFCIVYRDNSNAFVQFSSLLDWSLTTTLLQCSGCIVSWYSDFLLFINKHYHLNYNTTWIQFNVLLVDILRTPRRQVEFDTNFHHHTGITSLTKVLHCCS